MERLIGMALVQRALSNESLENSSTLLGDSTVVDD